MQGSYSCKTGGDGILHRLKAPRRFSRPIAISVAVGGVLGAMTWVSMLARENRASFLPANGALGSSIVPRKVAETANPIARLPRASAALPLQVTTVLRSVPLDKTPPASKMPVAKRVGWVCVDPVLRAAGDTLREGSRIKLDLFDGVTVVADVTTITQHAAGMVGVRASLVNGQAGAIYMASSGDEVRIFVDVIGGVDYLVKYDADAAAYRAIEIDGESSALLKCGTCEAASADVAANVASPGSGNPAMHAAAPSGSTEIDVMVVYTPAALAYEGSVASINANIALAIERANAVHANSETRVHLNLVHSSEIAYVESGDPYDDLDRLTYTTDGYMDAVHSWRNTYDADLVCLLESNPGTAGLAWVLGDEAGDPDLAFSLAQVQVTDWSTTIAHELAHNMGCGHSKSQIRAAGPGLQSYAAGWQWDDTASLWDGFCTIMTYQDFDDDGYVEYDEVPYFSCPSISYTGHTTQPLGNAADGDNARCIRETRYALQDYRVPQTPVSTFPYSNSFEQGFCDWVYYEGDTSWVRDDGTHPVLVANAPHVATTSAADGQWFVVIDPYDYQQGAASLEATFDLSSLSAATFRFSYCTYSWYGFQGTLTLQVSTNAGTSWVSLWSNAGEPDSAWRSAEAKLDAYAGLADVRLRFQMILGAAWFQNLACLDSFSLSDPAAVAPSPPTSLSPSGGVLLQDLTPSLTWIDSLALATTFQVFVSCSTGTVVNTWVTGTVYQVATELASGDYQWWVRGQNQYGLSGWSSEATFTIEPDLPDPVTPVAAPRGTLAVGERYPLFEWNAVAQAAWYHVVTVLEGQGIYMEKWVQAPATNWQSTIEFVGGDYNWWIRAWSPAGHGSWSDAVAFTIPSMHPDAPLLTSPTSGVAVQPGSISYEWGHDARATWYQLWRKKSGGVPQSGWSNATDLVSGSNATWVVEEPAWGEHAWYVRGWGPDGMGAWSDAGEFVCGKPTAIGANATQLTWDDSETASAGWYQIWINNVTVDGNVKERTWWFTRNTTADAGSGNRAVSLTPVLTTGDYQWSVRAWSSVHGMSPWSVVQAFSVP